jgi:hypothetical protein
MKWRKEEEKKCCRGAMAHGRKKGRRGEEKMEKRGRRSRDQLDLHGSKKISKVSTDDTSEYFDVSLADRSENSDVPIWHIRKVLLLFFIFIFFTFFFSTTLIYSLPMVSVKLKPSDCYACARWVFY